jgi:hypothetical protein
MKIPITLNWKKALSPVTVLVLGVSTLAVNVAPASAAALTLRSDTLSTNVPGANANHTIQFVTPTGASDSSDTIVLDFDTLGTTDQFDLAGISEDDVDIQTDDDAACDGAWTQLATAASAASNVWGVAIDTGTDTLTLTHPSNNTSTQDITPNRCVRVLVGTNATGSGTGVNQINNPTKTAAAGTADINDIAISGTFGDTGSILVATVESNTVSVNIAESLTFTMAGVASGSCTGDSGSPSVIDTSGSATTVPFGSISSSNAFFSACQLMSISTNATNGYGVTSEENTSLLSGSNVLADTACDSACTESTGTAWATATNNGLGYYCESVAGSACSTAGDTTSEYRQFACRGADAQCNPGTGNETIQTVLAAATPANNHQSRIHYKLSVGATQAAGLYSNTVTYIATPTF